MLFAFFKLIKEKFQFRKPLNWPFKGLHTITYANAQIHYHFCWSVLTPQYSIQDRFVNISFSYLTATMLHCGTNGVYINLHTQNE